MDISQKHTSPFIIIFPTSSILTFGRRTGHHPMTDRSTYLLQDHVHITIQFDHSSLIPPAYSPSAQMTLVIPSVNATAQKEPCPTWTNWSRTWLACRSDLLHQQQRVDCSDQGPYHSHQHGAQDIHRSRTICNEKWGHKSNYQVNWKW